ncbi:MAG: DNA repair protein RecO [Candidatus Brocadiaceae bacterium]|jgi:DNA repair protein RecO (recombination protein O)|nr:DNA repair protein RecO [Candidatus Brocadiaceae bacterium]OQZ03302.1 MAG: DNA repair protein RecO [Candidatus Brocadia sp. UTAMX1]
MPVFKTAAIALGRTDYSDSSQIITFYTRDYGKVRVLAKGFKRSSGRHSSKAIDFLSHYQIFFIKKEHTSLHTLTEAVLQNHYPPIRNDLDKYYRASCVAELINEFTMENDPSEELFDITTETLFGISMDQDPTVRSLVFEIKLLKILGYLPEWKCCVQCKNRIRQTTMVRFSVKEGGALCKECQMKFPHGMLVTPGAVLIAGKLAENNFQRLDRIRLHLSIYVEIEKMLRYYIASLLNKELNSWKYIKV